MSQDHFGHRVPRGSRDDPAPCPPSVSAPFGSRSAARPHRTCDHRAALAFFENMKNLEKLTWIRRSCSFLCDDRA